MSPRGEHAAPVSTREGARTLWLSHTPWRATTAPARPTTPRGEGSQEAPRRPAHLRADARTAAGAAERGYQYRRTNTHGKRQPTARTVTGDQCPSGPAARPGERSPPHTTWLAGWAGGDMQRGGFGRSSAIGAEAPNVQLASGSRAAATTPAERRVHVARGERAMRTASGRLAGAHLHVRSAAALVARGAHAGRPDGKPARAT